MLVRILIVLCCFLPLFDISAQEKVIEFKANAEFVSMDALNKIYLVRDQTITKADSKGKQLCTYRNNALGRISSSDVSDPLRILLFYRDFNQVVFLDNTLSELRSPLLLDDLQIYSCEIACSSKDGGFWLYDSRIKQIVYVNKELLAETYTGNIDAVTETKEPPTFLCERNGNIHIYFPDAGLLIFDRFGGFISRKAVLSVKPVNINGNKFVYLKGANIETYDLVSLEEKKVFVSDNQIPIDASMQENYLTILYPESLIVFKF